MNFTALGIGRAIVLCNNAELVNPCKARRCSLRGKYGCLGSPWGMLMIYGFFFSSILVRMSFLAPMGTIIGLWVKNVNVIAKSI